MSKNVKLVFLSVVNFVFSSVAIVYAQYSDLRFERFSNSDGLSNSTVDAIIQDKDGFMWFGTYDGLNKYDGHTFTVYRPVVGDSNSISSNRINTIEEDNDGRIWIGTTEGLNMYDKVHDKFYRFYSNPSDTTSISDNFISQTQIFYDSIQNYLWIATTRNGLNRLDLGDINPENLSKGLRFRRYLYDQKDSTSIDNDRVSTIMYDKRERVVMLTWGNHLNYYDPLHDRFNRVPISYNGNNSFNNKPKFGFIDKEGDWWIGCDDIMYIFNDKAAASGKTASFQMIKTFDVYAQAFYQDKQGIVWITTDGDGLWFVNKKNMEVEKQYSSHTNLYTVSSNTLTSVYEDKSGVLWIGSIDAGLNKRILNKMHFTHYYPGLTSNNGLNSKVIRSILEDKKGNIWVGTYDGGVNIFNRKTRVFTEFRHLPGHTGTISTDKILNLFEDHSGNIWVGTWTGGLNKFEPHGNSYKCYNIDYKKNSPVKLDCIWGIVEDPYHRLWLGTQEAGVCLFDPETSNTYCYSNIPGDTASISGNMVISLFIDSKNRLFVGTFAGLDMVDLNKNGKSFNPALVFNRFNRVKTLTGCRINYVMEDSHGNIWVCTDGKGLNKLGPDLGKVKVYTTNDGLPSNVIMGIVEDNKHDLWISTKNGISKLNTRLNTFKNYDEYFGLQAREFLRGSVCKASDGEIFMGGINGFNAFWPEETPINENLPRVVLTEFIIFNKTVNIGEKVNGRVILNKSISKTKKIILSYKENFFAFSFAALDFTNPSKNKYAYKMEGFDADWVENGNNHTATYTNLNQGNYTFRVKASNNDGVWNEEGVSLKITILPPPWETWWAYAIYAILLMVSIVLYRYYTIKKVKIEKELELDQKKLRFFINISHEFRTPLTLMFFPLQKILSSINAPDIQTPVKSLYRNTRKLLSLVNQLLDYQKVDLGKLPLRTVKTDIVKFTRGVCSLFEELSGSKQIEFGFVSSRDFLPVWFDPDKYEKILSNLISNAIKYTDNKGKISIEIREVNNSKKNGASTFRKPPVRNWVEIAVKDTGIGLSRSQLSNVFERFYHAGESKTGIGIGLNYTKSLVELHKGEIWVDSEVDKGSTFYVRLPLGKDHLSDTEIAEDMYDLSKYSFDTTQSETLEFDIENLTMPVYTDGDELEGNMDDGHHEDEHARPPLVIIVEDNHELRQQLKEAMIKNYKVKEAVDGKEGVEKINKYMPDLIISDIMMPKMDGIELCRRVKTDINTCHIPVILLTAKNMVENKIEGFETGADEYISKPFNMRVLETRIKNLLEARDRLRAKFSSSGISLQAKEITTNNHDETFLDKVTRLALENVTNPDFTLNNLREGSGMSATNFYNKITSLTGKNPSNFLRTIRLKYAAELLLKNECSIKEVCYMTGFSSPSYFNKTFRELFGQTPLQYMENHYKEKSG